MGGSVFYAKKETSTNTLTLNNLIFSGNQAKIAGAIRLIGGFLEKDSKYNIFFNNTALKYANDTLDYPQNILLRLIKKEGSKIINVTKKDKNDTPLIENWSSGNNNNDILLIKLGYLDEEIDLK